MNQLSPGYRYFTWLGCALHGNPFPDGAHDDVTKAIADAMARTKPPSA